MLWEAFHNDAISRTQTCEWYSCFNSGKNLEDPAHSGHKLSCQTDETLKKCINHLQRQILYDVPYIPDLHTVHANNLNWRFQHEVKCCKILPHLLKMNRKKKTGFLCVSIRVIKDRHFFSKIFLFPKIQIQLKVQRFKNILQFKLNHSWCWRASCKGNSRDSSVSGRGTRPSA